MGPIGEDSYRCFGVEIRMKLGGRYGNGDGKFYWIFGLKYRGKGTDLKGNQGDGFGLQLDWGLDGILKCCDL